jgi:hypothetical protein
LSHNPKLSQKQFEILAKRDDLDIDISWSSDDVITILLQNATLYPSGRKVNMIWIDCDKKTGVYRVFY